MRIQKDVLSMRGLLATAAILVGCSCTSSTYPGLDAVLWCQSAAEHDAAVLQVYRSATGRIIDLINSASSSADAAQQGSGVATYLQKPPAIVLDVDETVLDNSPFQSAQVREAAAAFDAARFDVWVRQSSAKALPGAAEFCRAACRNGISVFFVTNRTAPQELATRQNLRSEGFPLLDEAAGFNGLPQVEDSVLTKGERDWNSSDKSKRRAWVSANYRIVALVGDDLGDFVSIDSMKVDERRVVVEQNKDHFGYDWFVLPNPMYGSWERALLAEGASGASRVIDIKLNSLRTTSGREAVK